MTLSKNRFKNLLFFTFVILLFAQCETDPTGTNSDAKSGSVNFQMTDAPIDNSNIQGAFVTIAAVKVDGEVYEGFKGKQTIDLMAYQNGRVHSLGLGELEAGSYSNVSLVLDYEADANGDAPGCYILTTDNVKEDLAASNSSSSELKLDGTLVVEENQQTDIVMDFDLRKTIVSESSNSADMSYAFVSDTQLKSGIRFMNQTETGAISGSCSETTPTHSSDKIVVFAYPKGQYNAETETQAQGSNNLTFANASTSTSVDAQGKYNLAFLEDGEYELVFASYEKDNSSGQFELQGTLKVTSDLGLDLGLLKVDAGVSLSLDVLAIAFIPL